MHPPPQPPPPPPQRPHRGRQYLSIAVHCERGRPSLPGRAPDEPRPLPVPNEGLKIPPANICLRRQRRRTRWYCLSSDQAILHLILNTSSIGCFQLTTGSNTALNVFILVWDRIRYLNYLFFLDNYVLIFTCFEMKHIKLFWNRLWGGLVVKGLPFTTKTSLNPHVDTRLKPIIGLPCHEIGGVLPGI